MEGCLMLRGGFYWENSDGSCMFFNPKNMEVSALDFDPIDPYGWIMRDGYNLDLIEACRTCENPSVTYEIGYNKCNKNCDYCVSKIRPNAFNVGKDDPDIDLPDALPEHDQFAVILSDGESFMSEMYGKKVGEFLDRHIDKLTNVTILTALGFKSLKDKNLYKWIAANSDKVNVDIFLTTNGSDRLLRNHLHYGTKQWDDAVNCINELRDAGCSRLSVNCLTNENTFDALISMGRCHPSIFTIQNLNGRQKGMEIIAEDHWRFHNDLMQKWDTHPPIPGMYVPVTDPVQLQCNGRIAVWPIKCEKWRKVKFTDQCSRCPSRGSKESCQALCRSEDGCGSFYSMCVDCPAYAFCNFSRVALYDIGPQVAKRLDCDMIRRDISAMLGLKFKDAQGGEFIQRILAHEDEVGI